MMVGVGQGQSAENNLKMQIPTEINHNNKNYQHFLSTYYIPGTVLNPLHGFRIQGITATILRDKCYLLLSS